MNQEISDKFFTNTDHTGRFIVTSKRTGKVYAVEPMGDPHRKWGDLNPATKEIEGSYGDKYRGSINEKDSLITQENGFINIKLLEVGHSPLGYIDALDAKYPDKP